MGIIFSQMAAHENRAAADKPFVDIQAIALRGIEQSQARFDQSAGRLASIGAASPDGTNPDGTSVDTMDLSAETVALLTARNGVELNLSAMKAADRMQASLIHLPD